jgi:lipopolysaccharide transport system ATP-binding protein
MNSSTIRVLGLGKQYDMAPVHRDYPTMRDAVTMALSGVVGQLRRMTNRLDQVDPASSTFWALRDVSFEVHRGEVLGVIGPNGAGKSTLLRILSRITEPTEGDAWIHGKTAALLEVGMGFHPELTGRENIFLNGAILGIPRKDMASRFDEIVAYSGLERFIDTPVKRYSSGMYVRLAFSVAAQLDAEVLLIDEILAVGDLDFRARSMGTMERASRSGRTILFTSHNMADIRRICHRCVVLDHGQVAFVGDVDSAIDCYIGEVQQQVS